MLFCYPTLDIPENLPARAIQSGSIVKHDDGLWLWLARGGTPDDPVWACAALADSDLKPHERTGFVSVIKDGNKLFTVVAGPLEA